MSELQKLLSSAGSSLPVDSNEPGMSAGIAECNPTPQLPQAQESTNAQGTVLPCSFYGCKQTFSNMQQLSSHVESHQIPTLSLPGKAFHCSALGCSGSFPSMQHLMEHMRHHYKPNHYFLCESCRAKLRSYRALFKHLHTCAKVAKSKAAREEMMSPGTTATAEAADPALAYDAAAAGSLPADARTAVKEEPMDLELAPPMAESGPSSAAPPLASLQASFGSLPQEAPPAPGPAPCPGPPTSPPAPAAPPAPAPGPFSVPEPAAFPTEPLQLGPPPAAGSFVPSATPSSPLPYPPPSASSSPPAPAPPGQRPGRPGAPTSPAPPTPPGSNAVWKKNQGQSFSSRILWEHTRGRYSCLQCGHSTPTRQEMTAHIEGQHRSPAGRAQSDTDNRGSPPFQTKMALDTETAVYTQL